ncbi:hypothetical protein [Flammeovirga sp. EKP202]|uniref:hypothetical protein n=1 Tax=Flammeovirga sp. EKP202 TaxID=2770592 RepID=UPI00165ED06E|nr:hypothetical protein [Flammeovirga sp. EKP202]MBD0400795.1 hypothetical protein [Flammeovirga sp. EKP202]
MKKQIILSALVASSFLSSCDTADLDSLTERVEAVEKRLDSIGGEDAASLEATIEDLMALVAQLQTESTSHQGDISSVVTDLEALQLLLDAYKTESDSLLTDNGEADKLLQEQLDGVLTELETLKGDVADNSALIEELENVVNGQSEIWWGPLITDEDYTKFLTSNYTIVSGNVQVNNDDQTDALKDVVFIGGHVSFVDVADVEWAVENIAGNLSIENQMNLENVEMPNLKSIGEDLKVENNYVLATLSFPSLSIVGGEIEVDGASPSNDASTYLTTVDLSALSVVSGDMEIVATAVETLDLSSLEYAGGDFEMDQNIVMTGLYAPELTTVEGEFVISSNEKLETIDFDALKAVGGSFSILYNSGSDVGVGFIGFPPIGGEDPVYTGLTSIFTFGMLETVGADFTIEGNANLTTVDGFNALTELGRYNTLAFDGNENLEAVYGFNMIERIENVRINLYSSSSATKPFNINAFNGLTATKAFSLMVGSTNYEVQEINVLNAVTNINYGGVVKIGGDGTAINFAEGAELTLLTTVQVIEGATINVVATPGSFNNWCVFAGLIENIAGDDWRFNGTLNLVEFDPMTWSETVIDNSTITPCAE